ncbi:putative ABC transport system permease protein [Gemmobacter megaterium]|uniref:Putative ABC transport system permease protein n=1 Tax=Gemmobacter megaterium TaxID=1086013 RepID=A0A1N7QFQ1_9RHOB|nr:ABC transporter permease [Gemmobacter megaterium]GGE25785.1 ABC transporter permease [Gemmobacter megaterium]SIT21609.1 putative ABC transport system permease protein [Gemmobacter megaterium]
MPVIDAFLNLIPVTFAQSLMYAFVVMGIMIPFRLLSFPDLTSEGAFPLGGCVCAALILAGWNPFLATAVAFGAGIAAGMATALIHLQFRLNSLLAGILVFTALYSVNMRVMGRSNVALFSADSVFLQISPAILGSVALQILVFGVLVVVMLLALRWFLATEAGAALRVVGINPDLAPSLGINLWTWTLVGLGLANGLSAFGGALVVQLQGFADIGMGMGLLINGLASLVIGETVVGRQTITRQLLAPVIGAAIYYQFVSLGLSLGLHPSDLKLVTAVFVLLTLGLPALRRGGGTGREKLHA